MSSALLSAFKFRNRQPLKLVAVAKDPIAGDKAAGEAILQGHILHHGQSVGLEQLNFRSAGLPASVSDHLQSFAWLRDLAAAATRDNGAAIAEYCVKRWLEQSPSEMKEERADLCARRFFFWAAYAPYLLSTRDLVYRSAVLTALAEGARFLERSADRERPGLMRVTAWAGATGSALLIQGGPVRLDKGEAGLARAFRDGLHDDGGLVSRSPLEQLQLVEVLSQLRSAYSATRQEMPELLATTLRRSASALLEVTMGDGALGSWHGGNMMDSRRVSAAVEAAAADARPIVQSRGWGYHRLAAKKTIVLVDAAPPPPSRAGKGACASTLAFELSDGPKRLIVNCGGAGDRPGSLPDHLAQALRTTAAHSTLTFGDRNSTALLPDGTLGRGVSDVHAALEDTGAAVRMDASHDGYVRRFGLIHRRRLELAGNGLELRGEDRLERRGRRKGDAKSFAVRFHLGPDVQVTRTADGQGALLRVRGGAGWQFRCSGGGLSSEDSLWIDGEGLPHSTQQLVVGGDLAADGAHIAWSLKRAG